MEERGGRSFARSSLLFGAAVLIFAGPLFAASGDSPKEQAANEAAKAKAIEESVAKTQKNSPSAAVAKTQPEGAKAVEKKTTEAKKPEAQKPKPEKKQKPEKAEEEEAAGKAPLFFVAEDVLWEAGEETVTLKILGDSADFPSGVIDANQEGKSLRWRPDQPVVVKKKKDNPVGSSILQRIVLRENAEQTRKFKLEAPYYALDEILLTFAEPVSYEFDQSGNVITLTFSAAKKKEEPLTAKEMGVLKLLEAIAPQTASPVDILGTLYQMKEQYQAYIVGSPRIATPFGKMRGDGRYATQLFDGAEGFPEDIAPVLKQEYPPIGTREYWKKTLRASLKQMFGYSTDFDGSYGAWAGATTKDNAWTWTPDAEVAYNSSGFSRAPGADRSLNVSYRAQRLFPAAHRLGFGDGVRLQTINLGGNYFPQKRYSFFTQNTLNIFAGKTIIKSGGDWVRDPRHGHRLTNAAGFNYRLTRRLLWKNGFGLERTRSDAAFGRSRDASGFLTTAFEHTLTKRAKAELNYSFRHLFKDSGPFPAQDKRITKGKSLQNLSGVFRYRLSQESFIEGGPEFSAIDDDIFKVGARARLQYKWSPKDRFALRYYNGTVQDDTSKMIGGRPNRAATNTGITLSRFQWAGVSYWRALDGGAVRGLPKLQLGISLDYRRNTPLSGVYGDQDTNDDGFTFQTSLVRKLRGGLAWLELAYRFSTFRSKATAFPDTTDISIKEHAVLLILTNYFGEWGEMT